MLNRLIFAVSVLGVVLTIHLWVQKERGFDQGCLGFSSPVGQATSISECEKVVESAAGAVFGLNNIVLGFLFYVALGAISLTKVFVAGPKSRLLARMGGVLTAIGFLFSLYLVYEQLFRINAVCYLCLSSAALVTILLGLHGLELFRPPTAFVQLDPARLGSEVGVFALSSFLAGALLVGDVFFVNRIGTDTAQGPAIRQLVHAVLEESIDERFLAAMAPCTFDTTAAPIQDPQLLLSANDPFLGNPNADIVVIELFDPNCPHCKNLYPVLERVAEKYHNQARFYFMPFPLWRYSVQQIEALWLAAEQGKYFKMLELQFRDQKRGGLSTKNLLALADSLHLDVKAISDGLQSGRYRKQVLGYRTLLEKVGIHSAPKLLIDGRLVGNRGQTLTDACIGRLIEEKIRTDNSP